MKLAILCFCGLAVIVLPLSSLLVGSEPAKGAAVSPAESCVKTAQGPLMAAPTQQTGATTTSVTQPVVAKVGKAAPDFEATAFQKGGFQNVKLSDYKGKWVVLCFYPGDFTFV